MKVRKNKELSDQLEYVNTGCDLKLDNFEGPIELLWHMIKDAQMEIFEVKLADMTEQYLEYMSGLDRLDLEKASDFIDIAATLIEIKSKSLLPNEDEQTSEENDSEAMLLLRIKEYDLIQGAVTNLRPIENVDRFYKEPDDKVNDYRYVLGEMNLEGLLDAFAKLLSRVKKEEEKVIPKKIEKDRFTVEEKIVSIRQNLKEKKRMQFSQFFGIDYTRSEMINLFLAVLELLKLQEIRVMQQSLFDEIDIEIKEECGEMKKDA